MNFFSNLFSHESPATTAAKSSIFGALVATFLSPDGMAYLSHVLSPTYAPLVLMFLSALAGRASVPPKP